MDLSSWTAQTWIAVAAAIISLGAFVATAIQSKTARDQVKTARDQVAEARRQTELQEKIRRDSLAPYIWLDYRTNVTSAQLIDLVLKNEGPTTATSVKVQMDPPIPRHVNGQQKELIELPGFSSRFSALPPGREMRWTLGLGKDIFADDIPRSHTITISYDGPDGPSEPSQYVLDLNDSKHTAIYTPATMKQLVDAVKAQTKAIEKLN